MTDTIQLVAPYRTYPTPVGGGYDTVRCIQKEKIDRFVLKYRSPYTNHPLFQTHHGWIISYPTMDAILKHHQTLAMILNGDDLI